MIFSILFVFINGHAYKLYKLFKDILNDVKTKGDGEINEASNITTLKSIFWRKKKLLG